MLHLLHHRSAPQLVLLKQVGNLKKKEWKQKFYDFLGRHFSYSRTFQAGQVLNFTPDVLAIGLYKSKPKLRRLRRKDAQRRVLLVWAKAQFTPNKKKEKKGSRYKLS